MGAQRTGRPAGKWIEARTGLIGFVAVVWFSFGWWGLQTAQAVAAHPGGAVVRQPDGAGVTVYLRGDERFHWYQDGRGYPVTKLPQTGQWVYALEPGGAPAGGNPVIGRSDPAALGLAKPDADRVAAVAEVRRAARRVDVGVLGRAPTTGMMRNLVLLVNYSDMAVAYTRQEFDDLFNQVGYSADGAVGSVKDYYHEVSYNALTAESTVVEAVTLDNGYVHYGANDALDNDIRPREMVAEALAKLETRGFDFSTMDGDSDGWVDCLTIVHAGPGEECSGNDDDYIWSHKWQMTSVATYDGVNLWKYHTVPARRGWDSVPSTWGITRIGVVCHEMGHILGLPDLYDTTYNSEGVGDFCLMAGGSWNGSYGSSPAHMSAWCKVTLGWVTPTVIAAGGSYSLTQVATTTQVYKLQGDLPANEYFLVENRQGAGFDAGLPGASRGILIWHVDENQPDNTDPSHYKVDVEEASGTQHLELDQNQGDDADYFRTGNVTAFTAATTPNNLGYTGTPLGLQIQNIGATGATMSFDVNQGTLSTGTLSVQTINQDGGSIAGPIYVDGGPTGTGSWSGGVSTGQHTVGFGSVSGYTTPADKLVTVQEDQTTSVTGTYAVILPLEIAVQADPTVVASGGSSVLTASASGGIGPYSYLWNTGGTAASITVHPTTTTTYTVTVTDNLGQEAQASLTVTVATPVGVAVEATPSAIREGEISVLTATATGGLTPYAYRWNTGESSSNIQVSPTLPSAYSVTATDRLNQTATASVTVEVTRVAGVTEKIGGAPCVVSAIMTASMILLVGWTTAVHIRSRQRRRYRER